MNHESWLERGERLRTEVARLSEQISTGGAAVAADDKDGVMRVGLARWLREEFSNEPPADPAQLALLPECVGEPHDSLAGR